MYLVSRSAVSVEYRVIPAMIISCVTFLIARSYCLRAAPLPTLRGQRAQKSSKLTKPPEAYL